MRIFAAQSSAFTVPRAKKGRSCAPKLPDARGGQCSGRVQALSIAWGCLGASFSGRGFLRPVCFKSVHLTTNRFSISNRAEMCEKFRPQDRQGMKREHKAPGSRHEPPQAGRAARGWYLERHQPWGTSGLFLFSFFSSFFSLSSSSMQRMDTKSPKRQPMSEDISDASLATWEATSIHAILFGYFARFQFRSGIGAVLFCSRVPGSNTAFLHIALRCKRPCSGCASGSPAHL